MNETKDVTADPKARQADSAKPAEKEVDLQKLMNVGVPITLSFGEFRVKDLSIFQLIELFADGFDDFIQVVGQVSSDDSSNQSDLAVIQQLVRNPSMQKHVAKILALYCGADDATPFQKLSVRDFKTTFSAVKKVADFEAIKEVFTELLQSYLQTDETPTSTEKNPNPKDRA
jgi:hypothetical protein